MPEGKGAVVVTGGDGGIGFAVVLALLAEDYCVLACDIATQRLEAIDNPNLSVFRADVRHAGDFRAVFQRRAADLDIVGLVACAAVFTPSPFLDLSEKLWDETFDVNLNGALLACQAVLPLMMKSGGGSIVLLSSSLARSGCPGGAHYAAAEGAVLGLGRSLALEVADRNVRVNILSPGFMEASQMRPQTDGGRPAAESVPLGRVGRVDDMAQAVLFLLSDDSSYVTGQDLRVNGGSQLF